ncbi:ComEC/Rec2 family competence protein [Parabacteroides sp. AF17-28]|uniref:ComEC/Rec2 family competence protein n=1 Tax=Parabacteroides sp. AF17-28 TaxID=2292241 RepID=UPI000EFEE0EE|nr:ComEC/Rec2 family competence protein [Parabacteroides sp. AF17-28]RHR61753.1 ComEC/Rec2 family competence protein [Parabacteroides sp. AF17-28]
MIKELQIRPFSRPLLVWIAGIILQTAFPLYAYSVLFLLFPLLVLILSCFGTKERGVFCYETRWLWGAVFVSLLLFLSIQKTACSQVDLSFEHSESTLSRLAKEEQLRLLEPFGRLNLTDEEKSVLATITVGYREAMDRNVRQRFSVAGVAHILAVSGFHVAVVCGFLSFLLSFLPRSEPCRWVRYLLTVLLLWLFVAVTGLAASAVRAALMLTLFLTGGVLGRRAERYNILAASAFCMLVYEPLYLFDIGFQLSYLAVLSILYFQPRLQRLMKVRNPLLRAPWQWITVTLAAQVGTVFLCLYYFGQFSTVFLLTNLPMTLLATLLIPMGLAWMLLPAGCPGYEWLQVGVEGLTHGLLRLVDSFSRVPGAVFSFRFDLFTMLVVYGMLLFVLLYGRSKRPAYLFAALALLLIILIVRLIGNLMLCGI